MRRMAGLVVVVALAALAIPVAFAQFTDSGTFGNQITAADSFGGDESEQMVWVCKVVGSDGDYRLKEGKNPLRVGVGSVDAEKGFADAHPSYVVEDSEECVWPLEEDPHESTADTRAAPATTKPAETTTTVADTTVPSTTSTTTVSTTVAPTSPTTSTTTTSTTEPSTTTTVPEDEEASQEEGSGNGD